MPKTGRLVGIAGREERLAPMVERTRGRITYDFQGYIELSDQH